MYIYRHKYIYICVCVSIAAVIHHPCLRMQHSRLSFRRVFGYGDGVGGVGELRRSGSRHYGEHSRSTAAARAVESHDAQQVLSIPLKHQPRGHHLARLLVHREAAVTTCREEGGVWWLYFQVLDPNQSNTVDLNTNSGMVPKWPFEIGDSVWGFFLRCESCSNCLSNFLCIKILKSVDMWINNVKMKAR